jgi:hypothetical protein
MQIIAESEREKQEIVALSKYLHDFRVFNNGKEVTIYCANGKFEQIKEMDDGA